jgi:transcriptional regulator with GAF, ATPase, and Fis domain/tetratricopeptide (TPR) repeat protein
MDLQRFPDLHARFIAEAAHRGGEGTSVVVRRRESAGARLLLKLLAPGADLHEAGLLGSLHHPRIPRILEAGTSEGVPYLLRELAPGLPLAELAPLPPAEAVELAAALLEILAFVHLRGVLHLDIKPANVLVDRTPAGAPDPWLVDFGLGSRTAAGGSRGGTPFFAPPEVWLGLEPDPRADLFSLGATLCAVLVPDLGARLGTFLRRFPREDFLSAAGLTPADLPDPFDRLLPRLLGRRPAERFADAQEALEALRGRGSGRPSPAALALDPVAVHADALALDDLPAGVDLALDGACAEDREVVALQIACRLGDVGSTERSRGGILLRRGGRGRRAVALAPLGAATLAAHLCRALGLDPASAAAAAAVLQRGGARTATAASRALAELADAGRIVPDGAAWTWPDALSGRVDLAPAAEPTTAEELRGLAARGRIEAATQAYRSRAVVRPADEPAWRHALARGLLAGGEPMRALPLAVDLPEVRARALLDLGRVEAAAEVLAADPAGDDDARRRLRAAVAYQQGRPEDGLREFDAAARSDPENRVVRAYLLTALGRREEAEAELAAALELLDAGRQPFARAAALTARGELARRRGDAAGAGTSHAEALALYRSLGNVRNTASASLNLGVARKDLGDLDGARDALRRARALSEHVDDAAGTLLADANLGIVQLAAGDGRSAVQRFDRAIPGLRALGLTQAEPLLRALRARALASAGDRERAGAEIAALEAEPADRCTDPRIRAELEAARRALLDANPDPALEPSPMTDPSGAVPRTVFRTFLAINRRLASETDLEKAMNHLLEAAETVTGARASYLLVEREGSVQLEVGSRIGPSGDRAFSRSLANRAISQQRTMTAEDAIADRDLMAMPSVQDLRLRSALCVPFVAASGVKGALYVEHPGRSGAFGEREAEYLEALGDQAAIAVDRMMREEELAASLDASRRDLAVARRSLGRRRGVQLLGESPAIDELRRQIDRLARSDLAVLVQGETGTGKELVARLLHERSARADRAFVSENCSAIPAELMESELFGHVRGAFTGADQDRQGLLELASGGTLFLDEVGDMPAEMQAKLLRALQEGTVRRVGGRELAAIDVRLVTATHKDLRAMVEAGTFREDLYFRIAAGLVRVPPLRERGEDLALLARHFVERLNREHGRRLQIDDATLARLRHGSFPGNIRELEHLIARAFLLSEGESLVLDEDLPRGEDAGRSDAPWPAIPLAEATYRTIHAALRSTGGDKTAAAKLLGISRTALYEKLRREADDRPPG